MAHQANWPERRESLKVPAARWRRFVAFATDIAILALPTLAVGIFYFSAAAALGERGQLIGAALVLGYFTVFDSWWGDGRSPGKRLLKIGVAGDGGELLSPGMAALRVSVLYLALRLSDWVLDVGAPLWLQSLSYAVSSCMWVAVAYLFIFNRTRRSLHDLVAGAIVVDARAPEVPVLQPLWRGHWIVLGLLGALTIASVFFEDARGDARQLEAIRASVAAVAPARSVRVGRGMLIGVSSNGTVQKGPIEVVVQLRERPKDWNAVAGQVEDAIFSDHADRIGEAEVRILLRYGFDLGIANAHEDLRVSTSAANWHAKTQRTRA